MKNSFLQILMGVCVAFLMSCSGGGGISSRHVQIPREVAFVMSMDFNKLSSKSQNWREVLDRDFLKSMDLDTKQAQEIFQKVLNAGIDYRQKAYLFGSLSKQEEDNVIGFSFILSDPGKFESAQSENNKKSEVKKLGELKYIIGNENIIGWKDKTALFLGVEQDMPEAQLLEKFNKIYNTEAINSLSANSSEFTQIDGAGYDLALWVDQQKINALNPEMADWDEESPFFSQLTKVNKVVTFGLSFEKGAVQIEGTSYLDKDLSAQYEALFKNGIQNKVIKSIPIANPSMMFGFAVNMKTLYELLKNDSYVRDGERELRKEFNLTMEEVFTIFDGEFLLSTLDLKAETIILDPKPELVFSFGIANKKNLDKILNEYVEQGNLDQRPDFYIMKGLPNPVYLLEKNNILYITMSENYKNDILKGKGGMDNKYAKVASDKSFLMYLNIKDLMNQLPQDLTEGSDEARFFREVVAPQLEDMVIDSSPAKNHKTQGSLVINFTDKSKNSLVILADIFKKANKGDKALSLYK